MKLLYCAGLQDHASDGVPDRVQVLGTLKNMRMSVIQTNVRTSRIITNDEFMLPKYNYCRQNNAASDFTAHHRSLKKEGRSLVFLVTILPYDICICLPSPFHVVTIPCAPSNCSA